MTIPDPNATYSCFRNWLRGQFVACFAFTYGNRPILPYEIYDWENHSLINDFVTQERGFMVLASTIIFMSMMLSKDPKKKKKKQPLIHLQCQASGAEIRLLLARCYH